MTGPELRAMRRQRKLTQVQLAALLDVHRQTVNRWERGERQIHHLMAEAIEARLNRQATDQHQTGMRPERSAP